MENEEKVDVTPEVTEETTPEVEVEQSTEIDWKAEAEKQRKIAENQKIRAEKAEKKSKDSVQTETRDGLSTKDIIFLGKADIHEDDMDEVLDRAKNKKIPVAQAYKEIKPLLDAHAEERKSAATANTSNARRGSSQIDGETLLSQARTGKVPEGDDDIQRLIKTKMGIKK